VNFCCPFRLRPNYYKQRQMIGICHIWGGISPSSQRWRTSPIWCQMNSRREHISVSHISSDFSTILGLTWHRQKRYQFREKPHLIPHIWLELIGPSQISETTQRYDHFLTASVLNSKWTRGGVIGYCHSATRSGTYCCKDRRTETFEGGCTSEERQLPKCVGQSITMKQSRLLKFISQEDERHNWKTPVMTEWQGTESLMSRMTGLESLKSRMTGLESLKSRMMD
jgi:hypothetical protein